MISYEGASPDSVDCYLAEKLAPLQPVILWGRTASMDPKVDKSHAVYYWWLDFPVLKKSLSFYHPQISLGVGGLNSVWYLIISLPNGRMWFGYRTIVNRL